MNYIRNSLVYFFSMIKLLFLYSHPSGWKHLYSKRVAYSMYSAFGICCVDMQFNRFFFSEKKTYCKLIRTSQDIICMTHASFCLHDPWLFSQISKHREIIKDKTALFESKYCANTEVHMHVSISCHMSVKAHFIHFSSFQKESSFSELCCLFNEFKSFHNFNFYFYKINSNVRIKCLNLVSTFHLSHFNVI